MRKAIVMNIVGAVCLFLAGTAVFIQQLTEFNQTAGPLAGLAGLYGTLTGIAALSAYACTNGSSSTWRRVALWANWSLILVWLAGVAGGALVLGRLNAMAIAGVFMFVVPQAINIRALGAISRRARTTFQAA